MTNRSRQDRNVGCPIQPRARTKEATMSDRLQVGAGRRKEPPLGCPFGSYPTGPSRVGIGPLRVMRNRGVLSLIRSGAVEPYGASRPSAVTMCSP